MAGRGAVVVYVTSHGFGHLNRAVAVINRLPAEVPVDDPRPPEPVRPLARAAEAAGHAGVARLRRRGPSTRPATARRPTGRRRSNWPPAFMPGGEGAGRRGSAAGSATQGRRPCSATCPRCPSSPPSGRGPRLRAGQFHLGRDLRPACQKARGRGGRARGRDPPGVPARRRPSSGPSPRLKLTGFLPTVIEVGMVVTPGRDRAPSSASGSGSRRRRTARVLLRRALRPGEPRLGAARGLAERTDPLRRVSPGDRGGPLAEPPRRPGRRLDRGRPRRVGRRDRGQGRVTARPARRWSRARR